jgi:hypothetical protein
MSPSNRGAGLPILKIDDVKTNYLLSILGKIYKVLLIYLDLVTRKTIIYGKN